MKGEINACMEYPVLQRLEYIPVRNDPEREVIINEDCDTDETPLMDFVMSLNDVMSFAAGFAAAALTVVLAMNIF